MIFGLGGQEILIILFVVLLLFGAKKIPELARGLGKGIREFKDASSEIKREIESSASSVEVDDAKQLDK
jgi:sec-independent protein translocase protein TatA